LKAVVALGANMEDPAASVELAITLIAQAATLISRSSLYLTKPVGGPPQADFVNAVCIIDSELPPKETLDLLHSIEKSMGRESVEKWGPRVIDCDLIAYGDLISADEPLVLPHPRAHLRRFVLEPWLEIEPDAVLPSHGRISDILAQLPDA
jgi:2-amino-4-hydroxy-6-hydroxymethyldihydropteridine diphosphokinase